MIPKLETCLAALDGGVGAVHILDGRLPHVLLLETFTEGGVGTKIVRRLSRPAAGRAEATGGRGCRR